MSSLSLLDVGGVGESWPRPASIGTAEMTELFTPFPCQVAASADLWFAERADDVERAKALCGPCPIRRACLAGAIERGEPWGVWGGEVFVDGAVVARKRGRGRPRKSEVGAA